MNRAIAQAHPNIALVKYWGKRDVPLNLPAVGSISITLDQLRTRTEIRFDDGLEADQVSLNGEPADTVRVSACLDLLRERAGTQQRAQVISDNNFPTAAGLASSASGFAALVVAGAAALGLDLTPSELSELARRGSGSASRSIFGGFVEWALGERSDGSDSVARPLLDGESWPLAVAIAVTSRAGKAVGSTAGMQDVAARSPFYPPWVDAQKADLEAARSAIRERDFAALAEVTEFSCLKMHAAAMASRPGLIYWNPATLAALQAVRELRAAGTGVCFTIDAGPQVKAICQPADLERVAATLADVPGVAEVLRCGLGPGARVLERS